MVNSKHKRFKKELLRPVIAIYSFREAEVPPFKPEIILVCASLNVNIGEDCSIKKKTLQKLNQKES